MGVAVSQRSADLFPEVPGHRTVAILTSVLGHALLLIGLIVLGSYAAREIEPEPIRLVFFEPAPPPKLGTPDGGGAPPAVQAAPEPAPEPPAPAPEPVVEKPPLERIVEQPKPVEKPKAKPKPEPKPKPKAQAKPARTEPTTPPPAATTETTDAAGTGTAGPRGVAEGHAAGVEGGLVGGQVGGLGSDVTPVRQAAVPPVVVHRVMPVYPESARLRGIEGQVMIEAIISRDGTVEPGVRVVQSIPALDEAAIEAFKRWKFKPARDAQGRPLRVILQAPVRFVLR